MNENVLKEVENLLKGLRREVQEVGTQQGTYTVGSYPVDGLGKELILAELKRRGLEASVRRGENDGRTIDFWEFSFTSGKVPEWVYAYPPAGKQYFAFAIADSMFTGDVTVTRRAVSIEEVRQMKEWGFISALNPSHKATVEAMHEKYGLDIQVPATAPKVTLEKGDKLVLMSVRGLPRREGETAHYTKEEIEAASFVFSLWSVLY